MLIASRGMTGITEPRDGLCAEETSAITLLLLETDLVLRRHPASGREAVGEQFSTTLARTCIYRVPRRSVVRVETATDNSTVGPIRQLSISATSAVRFNRQRRLSLVRARYLRRLIEYQPRTLMPNQ